jgi:hypothetical protein
MYHTLKIFILLFSGFWGHFINAQKPDWKAILGGEGGDAVTHVTSYGNGIVVGGIFQNQINLKNQRFNTAGDFDFFITRMDAKGAVQYAFTIGNKGNNTLNSLICDKSGNIYFSGSFSGTLKVGNFILNSLNNTHFIARADSSGKILWAESFQSLGMSDINDLQISDDGQSLWLCGAYSDSLLYRNNSVYTRVGINFFVAKISSADGNMKWLTDAPKAKKAKAISLAVLPDGNAWVCGTFVDSLQMPDHIYFYSFLHTEIFLAHISAEGKWIRSKRFGGVYNDNPKKIRLSPDKKNIWMAGEFTAVLNIDTFRLMTARRFYNAFWIKMDLNGNAKAVGQSNTLANCYVHDLCFIDIDVIVGGYFQDSLEGLPKMHFTNGGFDVFWYGIDSSKAVLVQSNALGGSGNDQINAMINFKGALLSAGTFQNSIIINKDTLSSKGFSDGWIACLDNEKKIVAEPFTLPELIEIKVIQSKNSESFTIVSEKKTAQLQWQIYNLEGKKILNGEGNLIPGTTLKAGVYSLQVITESGIAVVKLVKP